MAPAQGRTARSLLTGSRRGASSGASGSRRAAPMAGSWARCEGYQRRCATAWGEMLPGRVTREDLVAWEREHHRPTRPQRLHCRHDQHYTRTLGVDRVRPDVHRSSQAPVQTRWTRAQPRMRRPSRRSCHDAPYVGVEVRACDTQRAVAALDQWPDIRCSRPARCVVADGGQAPGRRWPLARYWGQRFGTNRPNRLRVPGPGWRPSRRRTHVLDRQSTSSPGRHRHKPLCVQRRCVARPRRWPPPTTVG